MERTRGMQLVMGLMMVVVLTLLAGVGVDRMVGGQNAASGTEALFTAGSAGTEKENDAEQETDAPVVAIDSGHGGIDPGKIGVHGELEKEINLAIAQRVQSILTAGGVQVVMTREGDEGLYQESDANKKTADLSARCERINSSGAVLAVSIHQNSFHDASSWGAQIFYYKNSEKGKRLAEILQEAFRELQPENTREIKCNDNYYVLLHANCPMVVAECGFLSNEEEASLLSEESYREKVAWTISLGVFRYLAEEGWQ